MSGEVASPNNYELSDDDIRLLESIKKHADSLLNDYKDERLPRLASWADVPDKDKRKCHNTWFLMFAGRLAVAERRFPEHLQRTALFVAIKEGRQFMTDFITRNRIERKPKKGEGVIMNEDNEEHEDYRNIEDTEENEDTEEATEYEITDEDIEDANEIIEGVIEEVNKLLGIEEASEE